MTENYEDPSKKRRLDEDGTSTAFTDTAANARKEKLEAWLKPLNNEQLFKLLLDMCVMCLIHSVLCCSVISTTVVSNLQQYPVMDVVSCHHLVFFVAPRAFKSPAVQLHPRSKLATPTRLGLTSVFRCAVSPRF